jgi:integration host factor subunit beta
MENEIKTYTKKDLVKILSEKMDEKFYMTQRIMDLVLETFNDVLFSDEEHFRIEIRNFGVFEVKPTKERLKARNPKTNELTPVPEHRKISFKPSRHLKEELRKPITNK